MIRLNNLQLNLSNKFKILFLVFNLFFFETTYSQCTNPEPTAANTDVTFCALDYTMVSDLVLATGTIGGQIVWFDALTGGNQYDPADVLVSGIYYADDIVGGGCSVSRLAITVTVNGSLTRPANFSFTTKLCESNNPTVGQLYDIGTNNAWYDSEFGGNLLSESDLLVDGETYWLEQTENGCKSKRFGTEFNFLSVADPTITVADEIQEFCSSQNPTIADLVATADSLTWYSSISSQTPIPFTTALINGEDYWATNSNIGCEGINRVKVDVVIEEQPYAGENNQYVDCELFFKQNTVNLFDKLGGNPQTGGTWTGPSNLSGGYLGTFDGNIHLEGVYTYTITSATGICTVDDTATIEVIFNRTTAPTTTNAVQEFCEIDTPTIGDIQVTGNAIKWYATVTSTVELLPTDVLINSEDYFATQTNSTTGCESVSRLKVTVNINTTAVPTTSNTVQEFCKIEASTVADLQATGNNIKWYESAISTVALASTDVLEDGENYFATQTNGTTGCESSSRLEVTVKINTTPAPTTINAVQEFCEIEVSTIADLQVTGTNIKWYASATSTVALASTDVLVNGENYFATQTNGTTGCESSLRLEVTVKINITTAPTTVNAVQVFCEIGTPTIADIQVNGTSIKWYASATSTVVLATTEVLVDGKNYFATQTNGITGCESLPRLEVTVSINSTPLAPTTTNVNQEFCNSSNATIADLQATGTDIKWYESAISTVPLASTEVLVDGEDYFATQTNASGCESISRLEVTVKINNTPLLPTTTNAVQEFCNSSNATIADIQVTGTDIKWYESATSTVVLASTDILVDGEDYFATQTNASGCESDRLLVTIIFNIAEKPVLLTFDGDQFCSINNPTLADLDNNIDKDTNNTYVWYDSYPNGTVLSLNTLLEASTTYYLIATNSFGCDSDPLEVTPSLNACDNEDIITYDGFSPTGDGINDTFHIENIDILYPNYTIEFFNRWGNIVYKGSASKPEWNGKLNGTGEYLPVGVYYYIIYFNKNNRKPIQNKLYLNR